MGCKDIDMDKVFEAVNQSEALQFLTRALAGAARVSKRQEMDIALLTDTIGDMLEVIEEITKALDAAGLTPRAKAEAMAKAKDRLQRKPSDIPLGSALGGSASLNFRSPRQGRATLSDENPPPYTS